MKTNRIAAAMIMALLLVFGACAPAMAKVVSPSDQFYYLDEAGVLSEAVEGEIFFSNELLYEACGAQIVVVTLDSTGSEAIDDYAYELINAWGVGDKAKQNGFLLLLAIEDDDYYAVCGTGIQSKFSSSALKDYFDRYLEDDFAAKRYDAGVKAFFEAVFARVADTYNADVTTAQGIAAYEAWAADDSGAAGTGFGSASGGNASGGGEEDDGFYMFMGVLFIVLIIVLIVAMRRRRRRAYYGGGPTVYPIFFGGHRTPPPHTGPMNMPGAGGYRGRERPGIGFGGGYRPPAGGTRPSAGSSRPSSGSSSRPSSSSSRPSGGISFGGLFGGGSSSGSSSGRSSFGSARGGGGGSRGGGAGRGRH